MTKHKYVLILAFVTLLAALTFVVGAALGRNAANAPVDTGNSNAPSSVQADAASTQDMIAAQTMDAATQPIFESVCSKNHAQIQAYIDSVAKKYEAVGVQVAVIERGLVTDSFAFGWATKGIDPMTADHKIRVASISKLLIGMVAMRMCEDEIIGLDVPIGAYWAMDFQNPYYPQNPITIRSILSHTSSLADLDAIDAASCSMVKQRQKNESGYTLNQPGSPDSWEYNNYAFCVLGLTLELAGGKTLDDLAYDYFFRALGIDASFFAGDIHDGRLVTLYGYEGEIERSLETQREFHAGKVGEKGYTFAGGLIISANDFAKLTAVLASGGEYDGVRLLSSDSVTEMESVGETMTPEYFYQALPLRYQKNIYGRSALYYHTGSAYGVRSCMSYDPETGDGVIVLSTGANDIRDDYNIYGVCGEITDYIYGIL